MFEGDRELDSFPVWNEKWLSFLRFSLWEFLFFRRNHTFAEATTESIKILSIKFHEKNDHKECFRGKSLSLAPTRIIHFHRIKHFIIDTWRWAACSLNRSDEIWRKMNCWHWNNTVCAIWFLWLALLFIIFFPTHKCIWAYVDMHLSVHAPMCTGIRQINQ